MSIISDLVARLVGNEKRLDSIVNGDDQTVVETTGGDQLPSLAKMIKDNQSKINQFIPLTEGKEDKNLKDAAGGYAGVGADFMVRLKDSTGKVASYFTSVAKASRTWAFPDKSGMVALIEDLHDPETKDGLLKKLGATELTGKNTGDQTLESLGAQPNLGYTPVDIRLGGQPNGFPVLNDQGLLPVEYLPPVQSSILEFENKAAFPNPGTSGKYYLDRTTKLNYFWDGDSYETVGSNIVNADQIPEGTTNKFLTNSRVLEVMLTNFNVIAKRGFITANDNILQAFGEVQYMYNLLKVIVDAKAPINNVSFTGTVDVPTTDVSGNSTRVVNVEAMNQRLGVMLQSIQADLALKENLTNKVTNFGVVNDVTYPTVKAVKSYIDGLIVALMKDCGNWDASTNLFPTTGGSGANGAILKGNLWYVTVPGTLGGLAVTKGDSFRALVDNPGQDAANWGVIETNIGYVPVNKVGDTMGWLNVTGALSVAGGFDAWAAHAKTTLDIGTSASPGNLYYRDNLDRRRWRASVVATRHNFEFSDVVNNRIIYEISTLTGLYTMRATVIFKAPVTMEEMLTSTGTAANTGGIAVFGRPGFPQVVLEDLNQPEGARRYGMWIQTDGSMMIGSQATDGTGSGVMQLPRYGGSSGAIWMNYFSLRGTIPGQNVLYRVSGDAATSRGVQMFTANIARWAIVTNPDPETGSDAGSNFALNRYKDDGTFIDTPIFVERKTGVVSFSQTPVVGVMPATDNSGKAASTQWVNGQKGRADGLAPLGSDAKIPAVYLPSYVDDVVEAETFTQLPGVGERGKIYVVLSDVNNGNKTWQYRWSGTAYVSIVPSPGTTDSVPEGAENLYHTSSRVLNTKLAGLPVYGSPMDMADGDSFLTAFGKIKGYLAYLLGAINTKVSANNPSMTGGMSLNGNSFLMTGNDHVGFGMSGPAGKTKLINWFTDGALRFTFGMDDSVESTTVPGKGGDLRLTYHNNTGAMVGIALWVERLSGVVFFNKAPMLPAITDTDNSNIAVSSLWVRRRLKEVPYDISGGYAGKLTANERILFHITVRNVALSGTANASAAYANVAATAATTLRIMAANATAIGTITFAAGSKVGVVAFTSTTVASKTTLEVVGPATADATLADVTFTLAGNVE